ncbi:hypothetical protein [Streptomyces sp. NPDC053048]|uniref:hypothetical protein n=1 Tax=Streptomyces sp. NPDC053048 TaxID=3365694 RepID=UPI0037D01E8F
MVNATNGRSPSEDVGWIVGVAVLLVVALNASLDAAVVKAGEQGRIKAGPEQYVEFAHLYLNTVVLSGAVSVSIAVFAGLRILGRNIGFGWMWFIFGCGALLTALPTNVTKWLGHEHIISTVCRAYVAYYGRVGFSGGVVVGIASGLVAAVYVRHRRRKTISEGITDSSSPDVRAELPWRLEVGAFSGFLLWCSYMVIQGNWY